MTYTDMVRGMTWTMKRPSIPRHKVIAVIDNRVLIRDYRGEWTGTVYMQGWNADEAAALTTEKLERSGSKLDVGPIFFDAPLPHVLGDERTSPMIGSWAVMALNAKGAEVG